MTTREINIMQCAFNAYCHNDIEFFKNNEDDLKQYGNEFVTQTFIDTLGQGLDERELSDILSDIIDAVTITEILDYQDQDAVYGYFERAKEKAIELEKKIIVDKFKNDEIDINEFIEDVQNVSDIKSTYADDIYSADKLIEDVKNSDAGLATGFNGLDLYMKLPSGALTIIAGRPAHGKTTVLMNIMMGMIPMYQDKRFYFFSYEEPRTQIALKLINLTAGVVLYQYGNVRALQKHIKDKDENPTINMAIKLYDKLVKNKNLNIYDESYDVEVLCSRLIWIANNNNVGVIFIDYIQKIRTKKSFQSRQLEIQYVSNEILKVAKKYDLTIVLGCQLGRGQHGQHKIRLDNLRESGDIEQDANIVLGIFNPTMEKEKEAYQNGDKIEYKRITDLIITVLKNRDGIAGNETVLLLDRPLNKIKDV